MEQTTKFLIIGMAAVFAMILAPALNAAPADARIEPRDTSCTNGGGNQPGGQQPTCKGGGLEQETENQNPAGHAPRGHNR